MAHTYSKLLVHIVFATRRRERSLDATIRPRLYAYIGGIAREKGLTVLAIGGVEDHVHVLLQMLPRVSVSEAVRAIKGGSSHWLNETYRDSGRRSWQEGYGAFSIGRSQIDRTVAYIQNQEAHHQNESYQKELRRFVEQHDLVYYPDDDD